MSGNSVGSWYANVAWPTRNGVWYVGETPTCTLSKSGATAYTVRNYYGVVVSSGPVSGTDVTLTPPAGGWPLGWYRVYFTGPNSDATNGNAYAGSMFSVIRFDSRFPDRPSRFVGYGGETAEPVGKAMLGLGTSRVIIGNYATPTVNANGDTIATGLNQIADSRTYWHGSGVTDAGRPRLMWCSTPGAVADRRDVPGSSSGQFLKVYAKDETINGAQVFVASGAGTSSGTKIRVFSPDSSTLVETFDNLASGAAAASAINASSAYVRAYDGGQSAAATTSATAIGRTVWDGIVQVVTAFYPDVTRYEFTNEPSLVDETAHQMRLFAGAVHAGNADAKAIGPCTVALPGATWPGFAYCDEISFHDYNTLTAGALPTARIQIEAFQAALSAAGLGSKALWQTEAGAAFTAVYGVHHPRRARVKILHTLLWEQYGVPRERNSYWYDRSHGFWAFPTFWELGDSSVTADATLHRVLAEETYGQAHAERLSFGRYGDNVFLASRYAGSGGATVVLLACSFMPGAAVTLAVSGASSYTVVDSWGNTSTVTPDSNGRITVSVQDTPTYVRLPAGGSASVYRANDWPPVAELAKWASASRSSSVKAGAEAAIDDAFAASFGTGIASSGTLPASFTLTWPTAARADRVLIWNYMSWQYGRSLVDFDVQTSNDGAAWTTQATVTKPTPTSFLFGTNSTNTWCTRETFWDEQWIFDVPFPGGPVEFKYLRLYVRATSYGGEPDAAAVAAGGQGDPTPLLVVQEIAVLCDDNANRDQYVITVGS